MLKLKDFFHLPQLDNIIGDMVTRMKSDRPGMIIIAGHDPHANITMPANDTLLPSGRSTIFGVLLEEILNAHPTASAAIVAEEKSLGRASRSFKQRTRFLPVDPPHTYSEQIRSAMNSAAIRSAGGHRKIDLLVIERLNTENAPAFFEAVYRGQWVLAQFDTLLWGSQVSQQIRGLLETPAPMLGPIWIVAVKRLPVLCTHCRQPALPLPEQISQLCGRYPQQHDLIQAMTSLFVPQGCSKCHFTGRSGDVAVFDILEEASTPAGVDTNSRLSLEEYALRLVASGYLTPDDLLNFEIDQLRRTYSLLALNEQALNEATVSLQHRAAEIEAANRVLLQRTQVLFSLEDISQILTTSANLDELANRVCRRASELCGADRAILYYLHSTGKEPEMFAEVLAVNGWDASLVHQPIQAAAAMHGNSGVIPFVHLPPGVQLDSPGAADQDGKPIRLQAGLRLPLMVQDNQVGLMIVHSTQKNLFIPGEVALLQTFANHAAMAIQRAGLIQELRAKITQLEAAQAELAHKERLEHELELARQVQQSMLPRSFPYAPGYVFAASNKPARQVGGDFYDVIPLDDQHLGFLIADVSDKGLAAALHMALTRSLLWAEAQRELSPCMVLHNVNRLLLDLGEPDRFVSVFYAVIDMPTRHLTYCRAGHDRPMLIRAGETVKLNGVGTVLGVLNPDELHLSEEHVDLLVGDRLILYTDGLTDLTNSTGQFYGLEQLERLFLVHIERPLSKLCAIIFEALDNYQGNSEQFDDMTILALDVKDKAE